MFELLYFNQFSSFIVQLRSVNSFYRMNEWMNENMKIQDGGRPPFWKSKINAVN